MAGNGLPRVFIVQNFLPVWRSSISLPSSLSLFSLSLTPVLTPYYKERKWRRTMFQQAFLPPCLARTFREFTLEWFRQKGIFAAAFRSHNKPITIPIFLTMFLHEFYLNRIGNNQGRFTIGLNCSFCTKFCRRRFCWVTRESELDDVQGISNECTSTFAKVSKLTAT